MTLDITILLTPHTVLESVAVSLVYVDLIQLFDDGNL